MAVHFAGYWPRLRAPMAEVPAPLSSTGDAAHFVALHAITALYFAREPATLAA